MGARLGRGWGAAAQLSQYVPEPGLLVGRDHLEAHAGRVVAAVRLADPGDARLDPERGGVRLDVVEHEKQPERDLLTLLEGTLGVEAGAALRQIARRRREHGAGRADLGRHAQVQARVLSALGLGGRGAGRFLHGSVLCEESNAKGIVRVGGLVGRLLFAREELARVERAVEEADEHLEVARLLGVDLEEHDADLEVAEQRRAPDDLAAQVQRLGQPAAAEGQHELERDDLLAGEILRRDEAQAGARDVARPRRHALLVGRHADLEVYVEARMQTARRRDLFFVLLWFSHGVGGASVPLRVRHREKAPPVSASSSASSSWMWISARTPGIISLASEARASALRRRRSK